MINLTNLENFNTSCTSAESSQFFYRFINEKKKYTINLNLKCISCKELKKIILKEENLKSFSACTTREEDYDLNMFDELGTEIVQDNLISAGQLIVIERVPWYKISALEEKIIANQNFTEENIQKKFSCKLCKKIIKNENHGIKNDFYLTTCCGESACFPCLNFEKTSNKKLIPSENNFKVLQFENNQDENISPNIMYEKDQNKINNISQIEIFVCPFCKNSHYNNKISINKNSKFTNFILPNIKLNQMKDFVYNLFTKIKESKNYLDSSPEKNYDMFNKKQKYSFPQSSEIPYSGNCINNLHLPFFENSRFFIVKSFNKENLEISQLHNEWATTVNNQQKLNSAFKEGNVILIFSVNRSGLFQGYAIMKSYITENVSKIWSNEMSLKLGGSFEIQWLCSCELPFSKIKHLTNPLNNNETLIKSRDTQELPNDLGIQICNYMYEQEKLETSIKGAKVIGTLNCDIQSLHLLSEEIEKSRNSKQWNYEYHTLKNNLTQQSPTVASIPSTSRKSSYEDLQNITLNSFNLPNTNIYTNYISRSSSPSFFRYNYQNIKPYMTPTLPLPLNFYSYYAAASQNSLNRNFYSHVNTDLYNKMYVKNKRKRSKSRKK
jgi:hypothetical protein